MLPGAQRVVPGGGDRGHDAGRARHRRQVRGRRRRAHHMRLRAQM